MVQYSGDLVLSTHSWDNEVEGEGVYREHQAVSTCLLHWLLEEDVHSGKREVGSEAAREVGKEAAREIESEAAREIGRMVGHWE